jgi:uncharacterized phage infection (PIP) family protein YhgE
MENVFKVFEIKDREGNDVDVKELMGDTFENGLSALIGAEKTEAFINGLKKSNRIIQTASNVLYDLQGLTDSVRSISQQTGEYVAKIGNALRRNRIVPDDPEDSFNWMDEKMTPTSAFQKRIESISEDISNVTDFMGSLESVTSEVLSAKDQFESLKNNAKEFKTLVTEKEEEKTVKENESTTESQSPEIEFKSPKEGEENG